eukprot:XP_014769953.1 PREDICTED: RAB6-interacting golgin-like [Octopus bimaculoides]
MADWGGFTEDDLRQLSYPLPRTDKERNLHASAKKQANFGKQRNKNPKDRVMTSPKKRVTLSDVVQVMPVDEMLSPASMFNGENGVPGAKEGPNANKPKVPQTPPKSVLKNSKSAERRKLQNSYSSETSSVNEPSQGTPLQETPSQENLSQEESATQKELPCRELDEQEALSRELTQIEKFQHQQKLIEEKNKQTRNFLAEAIKDRWEKAETEAVLLTNLQKELSRLDDLLTADVSIIRDKIETSSLEYLEAQKRYEKAEKEFIKCKLEMFRKAELKEQLTEHLYTIIYQNEMRKAQKLTELMEKLKICPMSDEVECILPPMPPVPMYNPVNTIHSPYKDISTTTANTTTTTTDTTTTTNTTTTTTTNTTTSSVTPSNASSTDKEPVIATDVCPEKETPLTTPTATTPSQSEDSHTAETCANACPSEGTESAPESSENPSGDLLTETLSESSRVGSGDDVTLTVSSPVENNTSNIISGGNNNNNSSLSSNNNSSTVNNSDSSSSIYYNSAT